MISEYWGLWIASLQAARGDAVWWRSPFVWALVVTLGAFVAYASDAPLLVALATPLFLLAGLLWLGVMVLLALRGPDLIAGFVLGVVVMALLLRITLAVVRYL